MFSLRALGQPLLYQAGTHYTVLPANALATAQEKAELPLVTEVFWYGCPACHAFDPVLNTWVTAQGESITFSRVPAAWNVQTKQHAQLFAATVELGVHDAVHEDIFKTIHEQRRPLLDTKDQVAFLEQHGVDAEAAQKAFDSFQVDSGVRRAESLIRELRVASIPALIVRGLYLVTGTAATPTHQDQLKVVEHLLRLRG